jgi:spore coat assembly protein SafA
MSDIDTAPADFARGDAYVNPTTSPTIEQAFGGRENLKLLQQILDDMPAENEAVVDQPEDSPPPTNLAAPLQESRGETTVPSSDGAQIHTVIEGDTLWQIAESNHVSLDALIAANPQFAANPDLIYPGQQVNIPTGNEIAAGSELNQQVTEPADKTPADGSETNEATSVQIPPPGKDPLYDRMGWVEDTPDSRANALQFSDWATQSSAVGGLLP